MIQIKNTRLFNLKYEIYNRIVINGVFIALLILISVLISFLYITNEHFFYFWDYGGFQEVAISLALRFTHSPLKVFITIYQSIAKDYNYLYSIPLIPFILIFGDNRLSYVLGVALTYQMPYALATGAIATKLVRFKSLYVFWSTVFVSIVIPIAWIPTLRGYPDIGGTLFISLAVLVYLKDLKLIHWWQIILIGFLITAAILFRRHFAYTSIAFYMTISLLTICFFLHDLHRNRRKAWHELFMTSFRILATAIVSLVTLSTIGRPFFLNLLSTNYNVIYSSYLLTPTEISQFFISSFGWLIWGLATLGFIVGLTTNVLIRPTTFFIILLGCISFLLWILLARQRSIQYTLHITPIITLGITTFLWTCLYSLNGYLRLIILSASVSFLILNSVISLVPTHLPGNLYPFFSASHHPLVRTDYEEVVDLIAYLREIASDGEPIYVVDSSSKMNFDLIIMGERELYGRDQTKLNVLITPQIDSRDFYPLELLLKAHYLLLTTPFQHHLPPDKQKVVSVVLKAFEENWEIAQDFNKLPQQFNLADNATLKIYKRTREASLDTTWKTLIRMQNYIEHRPANQPDWIIYNQPTSNFITKNKDETSHIVININDHDIENPLTLLYSDEIPNEGNLTGTIKLKGTYCSGTSLGLNIINNNGQIIYSDEQNFSITEGTVNFSIPFNHQNAIALLFYISGISKNPNCQGILNWTLADK